MTPPPDGLRIRIVPTWGDQPFATFTEYRAPGNLRFQAEMLRFYLSDLRLVSDSGETALSDVVLIDLAKNDAVLEFDVPDGQWRGLRAGLGLPAEINHNNPGLYAENHPMSVNTGMHWSWANGYKFVLFDGRFDPDPASTGPLFSVFSVHTGMDTCFTEVDLFADLPFSTKNGSLTTLTLHADVHGFLQSGPDTIDVTTENQSHGGNYPLAFKLTRNVKRSLRLE